MHKKIVSILIIGLSLFFTTGCFGVKPVPLTADEQVNQVLEDLEQTVSSLDQVDENELKKLFADEIELDSEIISNEEIERIKQYFVNDGEEIVKLIVTENNRITTQDGFVVIDAELYVELLRNNEVYIDINTIHLTMQNLGTKWTGDRWVITRILRYFDSTFTYTNPAMSVNELLTRFSDYFQAKSFNSLRELLAHTVIAADGTSVNYYRNNSLFVAVLHEDFSNVTVNEFALSSPLYTMYPDQIIVDAILDISITYNHQVISDSMHIRLAVISIPEGLVISRLTYSSRVFGVL